MTPQELYDDMAAMATTVGHHIRDNILPKLVPDGGAVGDALIMTASGPSWEPVTIGGGGTDPVTPTLTPAAGSVSFTEDAGSVSYDLAVANVSLTGIVSVTPALPTGLVASVQGTKLKVAGSTTDPVAPASYVIVVSTASGNLTYTLALTVIEVIVGGWVPSNGSEDMRVDPTAFFVPVSQKANLQTLLDQHNSISLADGDYTGGVSGLIVKSNQKIYGVSRRTVLPGVTVTPGTTGMVLRDFTSVAPGLVFPASPLVTRRNVFSNLSSGVVSIGGSVEENVFTSFLGDFRIDNSAGGTWKGNRIYKPHSVLSGWELGTSPLGKASFWMKGSADRSSTDGNVLIALNGLGPYCGTLYADGGKKLTVIGWDDETYHLPYNGLAQSYVRNYDKFNLMSSGGSPYNTGIDTGADSTQIIYNDMHIPGPESGATLYGLKASDLSRFVSSFDTRFGDTGVFDGTGGLVKRLRLNQAMQLQYSNFAAANDGVVLSGSDNTELLAKLVEPAVPAGKTWARYPQRAVPDPLGPTWNVGLDARPDESAAIQALLDANLTVQLEPRAYYINQPLYLRVDQTLRGTRNETVIVAKRPDLDMIQLQFGGTRLSPPEHVSGLVNIYDLTLQGGNSGFDMAQPNIQLTNHTIAYVTFRNMTTAGIWLNNSYGMDNGWIEYLNFVNCGTGVLQRGSGPVEGDKEMYSDKTPFYRCQFLNCGKGLDLNPVRSNNMMAYIECLFKDGTGTAIAMGASNYPVFVNCQFLNNGGTTQCDGIRVGYVGCLFQASSLNQWLVSSGAHFEGCTFQKNGSSTVTMFDPNRAQWQIGFNYTMTFTNCTSDVPLSAAALASGMQTVTSINSQWPVSDGLWSSPLSHMIYQTNDTPFMGDNTRTSNIGYVSGAISPGSRFLTGAYTTSVVGPEVPVDPDEPLDRWKSGNSVAGKRVTFLGDSTTEIAPGIFDTLRDYVVSPGGEWEGAIVTQMGFNGQTIDGFMNQSFNQLVNSNPALTVICFGLNNVRLGEYSTAGLQGLLEDLIERIQLEIPNTDIVLWTPNSMLTTDPQSYGTVVPVSSAQDYTDRIWNAHNNIKVADAYDRVAYLDKQQVFGRVCQPTSSLMNDILHPNYEGQQRSLEPLITLAKPVKVGIDLTASAAAWAANPTNPWTIYPRALEDGRYATFKRQLTVGTYYDGGNNLLALYLFGHRIGADPVTVDTFAAGDVMWTPNGVYTLTGSEGKYPIDGGGVMFNVQLSSFPPNGVGLNNITLYHMGAAETATLTPTTGSKSFVEDAASVSYTLASMTTGSLASIASVTPALPTGLAASIASGSLVVSGVATDAAASAAYVIVANKTGGGTATFTLTLVVTAAPASNPYVFNAVFDGVSSGAANLTDDTGTVWTPTGGATMNGVIPSGGSIQTVTAATLAAAALGTGPFQLEMSISTTQQYNTLWDLGQALGLPIGSVWEGGSQPKIAIWSIPGGFHQASMAPYGVEFSSGDPVTLKWWRNAAGHCGLWAGWGNLYWGEYDDTHSYGAPVKITLGLEQGNETAYPFVGTIHSVSLKKTSDFE